MCYVSDVGAGGAGEQEEAGARRTGCPAGGYKQCNQKTPLINPCDA